MKQPDFIIIPMPALADENLQLSDKVLLGYIYWMTKLALMKCVASNGTLSELINMSKRNIQLSLDRLEQQGYICRIYAGEDKATRVEIECRVAISARVCSPVHGGMKPSSQGGEAGFMGVRSRLHHTNIDINNIDLKRDSNKLELAPAMFGNPDINQLFVYWEKSTGLPISANQQANRRACSNLFKKYGAEKVHQLIEGVAAAQKDQYAPRIADFVQLQSKLNQLLVWGKQKGGNHEEQIAVID